MSVLANTNKLLKGPHGLECVTVPAGACEGRRCCAEGRSSHGDDRNEDGGKQKTFPLVTEPFVLVFINIISSCVFAAHDPGS